MVLAEKIFSVPHVLVLVVLDNGDALPESPYRLLPGAALAFRLEGLEATCIAVSCPP
jgi:hypothetical protein